MQLKMATDYAIKMLIYLATKESAATSSELAEYLNISQKYVYNIVGKLKEANYVTAALGSFGGYTIKAPEKISLYDIVLLFEGGVKIDPFLKAEGNTTSISAVNKFYSELQKQIEENLKSKTLAEID